MTRNQNTGSKDGEEAYNDSVSCHHASFPCHNTNIRQQNAPPPPLRADPRGVPRCNKVVSLLKSLGRKVTALDLAASGINPLHVVDIPLVSDYFKPLNELMKASISDHPNERVILVGHSFGGLAISQAMENFPEKISVAVFVTALMPGPTLNISTLFQESFRRQESVLDSSYTYDDGPNSPPTTFIFGPMYLAEKVYQLSPSEDVILATMLLRPLRLYNVENMSNELIFSRDKYERVKRVFIVSEKDEVGKKDFQQWMMEKNPPDEIEEIKGSDHMVMMSKPLELCVLLHGIAGKYS